MEREPSRQSGESLRHPRGEHHLESAHRRDPEPSCRPGREAGGESTIRARGGPGAPVTRRAGSRDGWDQPAFDGSSTWKPASFSRFWISSSGRASGRASFFSVITSPLEKSSAFFSVHSE